MISASEHSKAKRGIKRSCLACEVRFYDLARPSIACPACGATFTPALQPSAQTWTRTAPQSGKTGWRSRPFEPRPPSPSVAVADTEARSERSSDEDTLNDTSKHLADDDVVLDQEEDEDAPEVTDDRTADASEH
jgi:hypothetical protein